MPPSRWRHEEAGVTVDLSPREAARQTALSRTLIYREIERGHLRAYKVGGRLRITPQALDDWKRRHAVTPRPEAAGYEPGRTARGGRRSDSFGSELRAIREEQAA
jgi:excisionase family DNA binding protein